MSTHPADLAHQYATLYQATLKQAAQAGESIIEKVLVAARLSLKDRATQARGFVEREHYELTLKLLDSHARGLCERYPQALTAAFQQTPIAVNDGGREGRLAVSASVNFDQLELMDSDQVHESVELARAQQSVMLAADSALAELNTYICAMLGMKAVQPERNPIRPDVYVRALTRLLEQTQVPSLVRMDWLQHMSSALGNELSVLYKTLSRQLHGEGIAAAGYVVVRTHENAGRSVVGSAEHTGAALAPRRRASDRDVGPDDSVLTLDRLRRLLVGELGQGPVDSARASFAAQFSREFESRADEPPLTDFAATVPAAFEALKEMKQVDRMMDRIGQRRQTAHAGGADRAVGQGSLHDVRDNLRQGASGLGQALSLEVVALMVENIARDVRLLDPIREVVKNLEPGLLRLALVDPRFFSDKRHPARRLLQEITHRSLAYEAVDAPGFSDFLEPLERAVSPLTEMQIAGAEPFAQVLQELLLVWDEQRQPKPLDKAVQALQHAEERNLLAEKIATEIQAGPDARKIPTGVLDFLCGPWSQVLAHVRMADASGSDDPGQYRELVHALIWSSQPELTRQNIAKLTRLLPKLLGKLREGLELIGYPSLKTSAFFELLMKLHQQAFRPLDKAYQPPQPADLLPEVPAIAHPWIAPAEARVSGFMELPAHDTAQCLAEIDQPIVVPAEVILPVGSWVELLANGAWTRTQLSWASPRGTLFLFTSVYGHTQSMTRRSRDQMLLGGTMRVLSGQAVVDGALDAVAQTAMRNSLGTNL